MLCPEGDNGKPLYASLEKHEVQGKETSLEPLVHFTCGHTARIGTRSVPVLEMVR